MQLVFNFLSLGDLGDPHGTHRKCLEILMQVQAEEF